MRTPPAFFTPIRQRALDRWVQLEQDPELAGPWHQLFKQVQSPRHILSELLQNADDAGATEASVRIDQGVFVFAHNGEDFTEEHFASLCRFGYSNKRALHTIGFRGIGFKSTFSLGDRVSLFTPTLAVSFHRARFTQPEWLHHGPSDGRQTLVVVRISDEFRKKEVEKNLQEWIDSPVSLLFFKSIRRIRIGESLIHWESGGTGPIPDSEWMMLQGVESAPYLLVRSQPSRFPDDALTEIRQERMLGDAEETEFPPARVEIVLGAAGRLYVVLPTGVRTNLPFACNAPFIQDPARLKIKDPEISVTNRWLLGRAGRLAARAMQSWLESSLESTEARSRAYDLFPPLESEGHALEDVCARSVRDAFHGALNREKILLTDDGSLLGAKHAVIFPAALSLVWEPGEVVKVLDPLKRPALSKHVSQGNRRKLQSAFLVESLKRAQILKGLMSHSLPRPDTWEQLLALWAWVAPDGTGYFSKQDVAILRIMPVHGKTSLYAARDLVRVGDHRALHSDADWEFLAPFLWVLDKSWVRFLDQRRQSEQASGQAKGARETRDAYEILRRTDLHAASHANRLINQVAVAFFASGLASLEGAKRLAQISAKLDADVTASFHYHTRDGELRGVAQQVVADDDGRLEDLLPAEHRAAHLLHPSYYNGFLSCSRDEWVRWVGKGYSGLLTFVPLKKQEIEVFDRRKLQRVLNERGFDGSLSFAYVTRHFVVEDWDFDEVFLEYWIRLAKEDDSFWAKVVERIFAQDRDFWEGALKAAVVHVATTGTRRPMTDEYIAPSWILRFQNLACLPDTRGFLRKPSELLRRTPDTEALLDVEPFVHGRLDREGTRLLLDLLGVSRTPTGPHRILDRLRSLSGLEEPPVEEVEKWYRRLDQMSETLGTDGFQVLLEAFRTENLILGADGTWQSTLGIFQRADEDDVPGAAVIRPDVRELRLWTRLGVVDRPTAALAIDWLKALPIEEKLTADEFRRARALMGRHPERIWEEAGCWLNLVGELVRTNSLNYSLTMRELVSWHHLHLWVKRQTADLRQISVEVASSESFAGLQPLATVLEERLPMDPVGDGSSSERPWLRVLGQELSRVELETEEETNRVRQRARMLAKTLWVGAAAVELVPYIAGTPAGLARRPGAAWIGETLYVDGLPRAKLARLVPEEIARAFNRSDIKSALDYAFERSPDDVRAYLRENFDLSHAEEEMVERELMTGSEGDSASSASVRNSAAHEPELEPEPSDPGLAESPQSNEPVHATAAGSDTEHADQGAWDGIEPGEIDDQRADGEEVFQSLDSSEDDLASEAEEGRQRRTRASKVPLIERFAEAQGFDKVEEQRYVHADGRWIARVPKGVFPWELCDATGELMRFYWTKDHCLEIAPLEIPAEVWGLIEQRPQVYSLVLADVHGEPVEWPGGRLLVTREDEAITLYPATYRLVYQGGEGSPS